MPIKYIQSSIVQMTNIIQTMQVEIEAKSQIIISTYENKITDLQQKLINSIIDYEKKEKETIDSLVFKNIKLSTSTCELESKIKDQTVIVI